MPENGGNTQQVKQLCEGNKVNISSQWLKWSECALLPPSLPKIQGSFKRNNPSVQESNKPWNIDIQRDLGILAQKSEDIYYISNC